MVGFDLHLRSQPGCYVKESEGQERVKEDSMECPNGGEIMRQGEVCKFQVPLQGRLDAACGMLAEGCGRKGDAHAGPRAFCSEHVWVGLSQRGNAREEKYLHQDTCEWC